MNVWNRAIFDALERRDDGRVLYLSLIYIPLLVGSVGVMLLQVYARMTTQRRWRAWLNNHLLDRWLKNGRYYQLNLVSGDHQNPEYRIADDVRVAAESPVEFATGLLTAVLSAITFILVLWTIGGTLTLTIAGATITIPGFLVIAAVIYAVLASGSMVFIGRRFVTVSENKLWLFCCLGNHPNSYQLSALLATMLISERGTPAASSSPTARLAVA